MIVLVVDDDPVMQLLTTHVLTADGHNVHVTGSGADAVELVKREIVDLVLLDLILADEDGLDVGVQLREHAAGNVEIILFSGRSDVDNDPRLATARIAGMIRKPFDPATLCDHIRGLLSQS